MSAGDSEYQLSCELGGHESPVRCVTCSGNDVIVTGETNSVVRVWYRKGPQARDFEARIPFTEPMHGMNKLLFAIRAVPENAALGFGAGTFISGGNDNTARVWTLDGQTREVLTGHRGAVCSITISPKGNFITGSFDSTARIWKKDRPLTALEGHTHGVEVCYLSTGEIVTGSYKDINIWVKGKLAKTLTAAHDHQVRKLVTHPVYGFVSCSNDGLVKVWTAQGDLVQSIEAHPQKDDIPSFVYAVVVTPDGDVVSSGEDRTVRVWGVDGSLKQCINLPCVCRDLTVLPNGDLVAACSDNVARVFSRADERAADEELRQRFAETGSMIHAANMQSIDTSSLAGHESLSQPGDTKGEVRMVNHPQKGATVYEWDGAAWVEIGAALGQSKKPVIDGVQYDFVTEVHVDEQRKVKLGFNKDEDPDKVARAFCERYCLDLDNVGQIAQHLHPLADPAARAARLQREAAAAKDSYKQLPSWKHGGFHLYAKINADGMCTSLRRHASEAGWGEQDLQLLDELLSVACDAAHFHVDTFAPNLVRLVGRMLTWSDDRILPVLDVMRVLMLHCGAVKRLDPVHSCPELANVLLKFADSSSVPHVTLVMKIVCNWVAKRARSEAERNGTVPGGEEALVTQLLHKLSHACKHDSAGVVLAYVMATHNILMWYCKFSKPQSEVYVGVAEPLLTRLSSGTCADKTLFYGMLSVGTICFASETALSTIESRFAEELNVIVSRCTQHANAALTDVAHDFRKMLRLG